MLTRSQNTSLRKLKTQRKKNVGIVYLIQPIEFIGTNTYKIGCSSKPTLDRVRHGYRSGTRYLYVCEIEHPFVVEKKIIRTFKEKFILSQGREYFSGDEQKMKELFLDIIHGNMDRNIPEQLHINMTEFFQTDFGHHEISNELKIEFL